MGTSWTQNVIEDDCNRVETVNQSNALLSICLLAEDTKNVLQSISFSKEQTTKHTQAFKSRSFPWSLLHILENKF